jgi:hypothetical protein
LSQIALEATDTVGRDIIINIDAAMKIIGGMQEPQFFENTLSKTIINSNSQNVLGMTLKTNKSASFLGGS